jgi:Flp pilus assembly protein TadG
MTRFVAAASPVLSPAAAVKRATRPPTGSVDLTCVPPTLAGHADTEVSARVKARSTSGAAALEFALVGLAFMSLAMLTMETGWQLMIDSALVAGARAASRFGSTGQTVAAGITPAPSDRASSIVSLVLQSSGGLLQAGRLQFTAAAYPDVAAVAGGHGTPGPGTASQIVQYTFTYTQPYLTPIAAAITGSPQLIHSAQVIVLNEPFPAN